MPPVESFLRVIDGRSWGGASMAFAGVLPGVCKLGAYEPSDL